MNQNINKSIKELKQDTEEKMRIKKEIFRDKSD